MKMRKHNYLVGYKGEGNIVYGSERQDYRFTNPMTFSHAKRLSKKIFCFKRKKKVSSVIYKLVEVSGKK